MGLPTETDEDLDGIVALAYKVLQIGDEIRREQGGKGPGAAGNCQCVRLCAQTLYAF